MTLTFTPTGDHWEDQRLSQIKAHLEKLPTAREALLVIENARRHIRNNIRCAFATHKVLMVLSDWEEVYRVARAG